MSSGGEDFVASLKAEKAQTASSSTTSSDNINNEPFNLNSLGMFIDRWSNVFEGMADKKDAVRTQVLKDLQDRKIAHVKLRPVKATVGGLLHIGTRPERPYIVAETQPGVTTAIYVGESGSDLYVSWRTHVKGVFNIPLIRSFVVLAVIPALLFLLCGLCTSYNLRGGINLGLGVSDPTLGLGSLLSGGNTQNQYNQYANPPNDVELFFRTLGGWLGWILQIMLVAGVLIFASLLIGTAAFGHFLRNDPLYYFYVEPTIFDAENVAALSTTVHQVLLHAVDSAGIDITKIPEKVVNSGRRSDRI